VLNPIDSRTVVSNGNLTSTFQTGLLSSKGTFGVSSGKWYWEATLVVSPSSEEGIGIAIATWSPSGWVGDSSSSFGYWGGAGSGYVTGVKYPGGTTYGAGFTQGAVIGIALDMDAGTLVFYKNGVSQGTFTTGLTGTWMPAVSNQTSTSSWAFNFGQRGFLYTPPSGFVALNTFNLPTPTIGATASTQANKYMDVVLYAGTGASNTITNGGFTPSLNWTKARNKNDVHLIVDQVRGGNKTLIPSNGAGATGTDAEGTYSVVTSFNSNGVTLGADPAGLYNASGYNYVAWQWAGNGTGVTNTDGSITSTVSANTSAGFSVITYDGIASAGTVGHGLGVAPKMIIVKRRSSVDPWVVWHTSLANTEYLYLNSTAGKATNTTYWNSTFPTSSVFSLGLTNDVNATSSTYVAYVFSEIAGYSKFGSYTGNGSADGPFLYFGFRPAFIMFKRTSSAVDWTIYDNKRIGYNPNNYKLRPNVTDAEYSTAGFFEADIVSNGFKIRTSDAEVNTSGQTYIYMAFAESPFNYANAR
jgi:hypothetical protein